MQPAMNKYIKQTFFAFDFTSVVCVFSNRREFGILAFHSRWNASTVTRQPLRICFALRQKMCQPHFQKVTGGYAQHSRGEASENVWDGPQKMRAEISISAFTFWYDRLKRTQTGVCCCWGVSYNTDPWHRERAARRLHLQPNTFGNQHKIRSSLSNGKIWKIN